MHAAGSRFGVVLLHSLRQFGHSRSPDITQYRIHSSSSGSATDSDAVKSALETTGIHYSSQEHGTSPLPQRSTAWLRHQPDGTKWAEMDRSHVELNRSAEMLIQMSRLIWYLHFFSWRKSLTYLLTYILTLISDVRTFIVIARLHKTPHTCETI